MSDNTSGWQDWPFEPRPVLRALARRDVDYVLVGGLAAVLEGFPLLTFDIDIVLAPGRESRERLEAALADLGEIWTAQPGDRVLTRYGYVDVHSRLAGFSSYRDIGSETHLCLLEPGVAVKALSLRGVIRSRVAAGDHRQLPALQATLELAPAAPGARQPASTKR